MKTRRDFTLSAALLLLLGGGVLALAACASGGKGAAGAETARPARTAASGTRLWAENCSRCHNSRPPSIYSDAEWDVAMLHMRVRANLTEKEYEAILAFLKAAN